VLLGYEILRRTQLIELLGEVRNNDAIAGLSAEFGYSVLMFRMWWSEYFHQICTTLTATASTYSRYALPPNFGLSCRCPYSADGPCRMRMSDHVRVSLIRGRYWGRPHYECRPCF
jgi:hypothetical protein